MFNFFKRIIKGNKRLYLITCRSYAIARIPSKIYEIVRCDRKCISILGYRTTIRLILYKVSMLFVNTQIRIKINNKKHKIIRDFLGSNYNLVSINQNCDKNLYPDKIWVCWLQGEETAPPLIKVCLDRIRHFSNGHDVVLITKDNYTNYVDVPSVFLERVREGRMYYAHLSDYIRYQLLYKYGGGWLDATLFVNRPIGIMNEFNYDFYSIRFEVPLDDNCVAKCRWMTPVVFCKPGNSFLYNIYKIFEQYNLKYDYCIDYLLIDYIMDFLVNSCDSYRKMINDIPYNNSSFQDLSKVLNFAFDKDLYDSIMSSDTTYYKLTYKGRALFYKDGKPTFYNYIINHSSINDNTQ